MNASQRRTLARARIRALSAAGIMAGATVHRTPAGKAHPTAATVEHVYPRALLVRRADKQTATWPLRDVHSPEDKRSRLRFRDIGKGHARHLSAAFA